jgi:hypothetical protein
MLSGYEKRLYHCSECGDFEVATDKYYDCDCGKYQGLQQRFECGLSKHYDKGAFSFPEPVYQYIEKIVDDFDFLTEVEHTQIALMKADFEKFNDMSNIDMDVTFFASEITMPDGRKEIYSFHFEIEQRMYRQYEPTRTNQVYLGRQLTEKYNNKREDLVDDLKAFHSTMTQMMTGELDLFKDAKELQEKYDHDNDYETIKVDKYIYYPTKDTVCD